MSIRLRGGLLILFAGSCGSGHHAASSGGPVSASGAVTTFSGSCVDPTVDAGKRLADVSNVGDAPFPQPTADLDGDGMPDRVYTAGAGVTTNGALYVLRGACGHFVGDVGAAPESSAATTRTKGLLDLKVLDSTMCEGARCGCEPGENVFRFDGVTYVKDAAASKAGHENVCPE